PQSRSNPSTRRLNASTPATRKQAMASPSWTTDFTGRGVLVTGASGGIGTATVRKLASRGATVYAAGRDPGRLATLAAETGARPVVFDLGSEDEIRAAVSGLDLWGVVNCGGFGGEIATPQDTDIAVFDKVISVN